MKICPQSDTRYQTCPLSALRSLRLVTCHLSLVTFFLISLTLSLTKSAFAEVSPGGTAAYNLTTTQNCTDDKSAINVFFAWNMGTPDFGSSMDQQYLDIALIQLPDNASSGFTGRDMGISGPPGYTLTLPSDTDYWWRINTHYYYINFLGGDIPWIPSPWTYFRTNPLSSCTTLTPGTCSKDTYCQGKDLWGSQWDSLLGSCMPYTVEANSPDCSADGSFSIEKIGNGAKVYFTGWTIGKIFSKIIPVLLGIAGLLLVIFIIISGIQVIISSGNPKSLASARGRLLGAVIGFAVIFLAIAITMLVQKIFGMSVF